LDGDEVIVSISSVPKMPWPVSNRQFAALMLPFARPSKLSVQTCFHAGAWPGEPDADDEHP
jgi:hypothetical protein